MEKTMLKYKSLLLIAYSVILYWLLSTHLENFNVDWRLTFYPATRLLLSGQNPYLVTTLHNPAWALIPLIPMALFGEKMGGAILFFVSVSVYALVARRFGKFWLFLLSPIVIYALVFGNIDWLVLLGLLFPPSIGMFFVVMKPQMGIGIVLWWAWKAWKEKSLVKTFTPIVVALLATFMVYGNWLSGRTDDVINASWNMSIFPYSIPIGLYLIYKKKFISCSPFLSPYLMLGSWSVVLLELGNKWAFAIFSTLWAFALVDLLKISGAML
jgi:hypothetical protein